MRFTSYMTAGALTAFASAQTYTECNPMKKDCANQPAMAAKLETDFRAGADSVKGWKQTAGSLTYSEEGAQFTIKKQGDAPTIQSETYLQFGRVEVKCKAAAGQGIISSIVLQSEDLDEIDWEFIGGLNNNVQTNYFGKGNTTTYDRMLEYPVDNTQTVMHTYALDWTAESISYIVDGTTVRTLNYADANGGKNYPQTPSTVRIGIWAGGDPSNDEGTIEWAYGETDYTKAPFTMTVESVIVTNYSPGKEYKWTDKSGSYESIEVVGEGDIQGAAQNSVGLEASATASGKGLQSAIDIPSATPSADAQSKTEKPSTSTLSHGDGTSTSSHGDGTSTSSHGNGTSTSCSYGVTTVTVTGTPPQKETATTLVSSAPAPPAVTVPASTIPPYPTTGLSSAPSVVVPTGGISSDSNPPYPTNGLSSALSVAVPTGGIRTDTNPIPTVPLPTGGNSTYQTPSTNASTSAPAEFPGAASSNKAGAAVVVIVAAAMLLV